MEDPEFTILLTGASGQDPAALRAVREATGLSLWHSKQFLASAPATIRSDLPFRVAARMVRDLRRAGVAASIRCGSCDRTVPHDTPVDPGPCAARYWPPAHCQANSLTSCDCGFCTAYGPLRDGYTAHPGP